MRVTYYLEYITKMFPFTNKRSTTLINVYFALGVVSEFRNIAVRDEYTFHGKPARLLRSHGGRDVPG